MRKSMSIGVAAGALAWLLPAGAALAQAPGEVRFYEENDFFNPFTEQTDRYYTQGLSVEWLQPSRRADANFLPEISHAAWCSLVCGKGWRQGSVNTGYAIGQAIYTPREIRIARPQPDDRPWAGLLYGSRIARISYAEPKLGAERQDRIELSLGVVGPAALARQAQSGWHHIIGADQPRGWANQLRNEPVLQLRYETALRWQDRGGHADIIPRLSANLGNALVSLEAEVTGRIGWNLAGFGVPLIRSAPMSPALREPPNQLTSSRWLASGNLFARAGIKAVAHNIFLDGNTFASNDIRVSRTPFVPEFAIGAELNLVGNFWVTAQFVHRGSEFEDSAGRKAPGQDFGAITLAVTFD